MGCDLTLEDLDRISFYKENEPMVVLQKVHMYHPSYTNTILRRLKIDLNRFVTLLKECKVGFIT